MGLYRPTQTRKRPNGTEYKQRSKVWVCSFKNLATGERVTRSTGTRDRTAAMAVYTDARRAAEAETRQAAQDARDPTQRHARRSVAEHLDDWEAYLLDFRATPASTPGPRRSASAACSRSAPIRRGPMFTLT